MSENINISKSYAQETNYYATFTIESLKDLKFYLSSINLPNIELEYESLNNRYSVLPIFTGKLNFEELSLQVLVDEKFYMYTNILDEIFSYKDTSSGKIENNKFNMNLFVTTNKGNPILKFEFEDCFITSLSSIEFQSNKDIQYLSYNLKLKFLKFKYSRINE